MGWSLHPKMTHYIENMWMSQKNKIKFFSYTLFHSLGRCFVSFKNRSIYVENVNIKKAVDFLFYLYFLFIFFWIQRTKERGRLVSKNREKSTKKINAELLSAKFQYFLLLFLVLQGCDFCEFFVLYNIIEFLSSKIVEN